MRQGGAHADLLFLADTQHFSQVSFCHEGPPSSWGRCFCPRASSCPTTCKKPFSAVLSCRKKSLSEPVRAAAPAVPWTKRELDGNSTLAPWPLESPGLWVADEATLYYNSQIQKGCHSYRGTCNVSWALKLAIPSSRAPPAQALRNVYFLPLSTRH